MFSRWSSACAIGLPSFTKASWCSRAPWPNCAPVRRRWKTSSCAWSAPSGPPKCWIGYSAVWRQASAIVWAQWRTQRNYFPRSNKASFAFSTLLSAGWYGIFVYFAFLAAVLLSKPEEVEAFRQIFPSALLLCFLYWQLIPILMASMGSALDTRKLLVYPIPPGELFGLEVLLRISTGIEMVL